MPDKCVFCDIVSKKIKSFIVYEDLNSVAFLDIAPRSTGMSIAESVIIEYRPSILFVKL